jgi:hypothetical protein
MHGNMVPNFERFKQMLEELGHDSEMYVDPVGVKKFKIWGLKSLMPVIA